MKSIKEEADETLKTLQKDTPLAQAYSKAPEKTYALTELFKAAGVCIQSNERLQAYIKILVTSATLIVALCSDSPSWLQIAMVLDIVSFTVTAPSTGAAMSIVSGDSAQIRNGSVRQKGDQIIPTRILGLAAWTKAQAVGVTQWVWPSGADQVRGNRYRNLVNSPYNVGQTPVGWKFRPQDPITVTQIGSAVAGDVELAHMLVWYEDLPGVAGRLIDVDTLMKRGVQCVTVEDTTTAAAASTYGGARALNAAADLLLPDTDYAVLGAVVGVTCGALCIQGVDNGGLRFGIPGMASPDPSQNANFFVSLAQMYGLPLIPVINRANSAGTFITNVQDENLTAVPFSLMLVQLDRRSETPIEIKAPIEGGPKDIPKA